MGAITDANILVVDDDPDIRALVKAMLRKKGYKNVSDTGDVYLAFKKVDSGQVDLVLLDWWMPQMQGIDFLKAVRASYAFLPIIMLTREKEHDNVMLAIKAGVTDYLIKSFTAKELYEKIEKALKNRMR